MYFAYERVDWLSVSIRPRLALPSASPPANYPSDYLVPLAYPGLFWRRDINSGPSRLSFHSRTSGNRASDAMQIIDDLLFTVDVKSGCLNQLSVYF